MSVCSNAMLALQMLEVKGGGPATGILNMAVQAGHIGKSHAVESADRGAERQSDSCCIMCLSRLLQHRLSWAP